jgi:hypothetical protein
MQLAEPLFLKHYITLDDNAGAQIELTFLENHNAAVKVTGIAVEELPMLRFEIYESHTSTHQVVKKALAIWEPPNTNGSALPANEPLTIREVTVYFNRGMYKKAPIGEITIVRNIHRGGFDLVSTSGSSDGSGRFSVKAQERMSLLKVDYAYVDQLKPWFKLMMSGVPMDSSYKYPLELDKGDQLEFSYQFSIPNDEPAAMEVYGGKINLHLRKSNGQTVFETIPFQYQPNLDDDQIKALVRSGGKRY